MIEFATGITIGFFIGVFLMFVAYVLKTKKYI
jgi:hypothetical protein